jgi:hypothetical protein
MSEKATYVYCLIAAGKKPALRRAARGLAGAGAPRAIEVDLGRLKPDGLRGWLIVADAPLDRYGEAEINRRLHDLDWVAAAAVAHERVVESFVAAPAILPMKLFTIYTSDSRAVDAVAAEAGHVRAVLTRVLNHDEWGVRAVLDRTRATVLRSGRARAASGAGYLAGKRAQHEATAGLAKRSRAVVGALNDRLAKHASVVKRRAARELPVRSGPLLLDVALLVSRTRSKRFRAAVEREARTLEPKGYRVTLSGPWPPYSFLD